MKATRPFEGKKLQAKSFAIWLLIFASTYGLYGCSVASPYVGFQREEPSYNEELLSAYNRTQLNKSITLDVLPMLQSSRHDQLSHSDSVVAALGQGKKGYKTWFTMAAFDENKLTAKRKYFCVIDEKITRSPVNRTRLFFEPKRGLAFDCQTVLEKELLDESDTTEFAKQIAILRQVSKDLRRDISELSEDIEAPGYDNKTLNACAMLLNQTFEMILLTLEASPALTNRLSDTAGMEFDHINFNKGRVRMAADGDIVKIKIRLGALTETFAQ